MSGNNYQKEVFLTSEGDGYFNRNKDVKVEAESKNAYEIYRSFIKPGDKVLEIGCSSGANLNWLSQNTGCLCYGVDPSRKAVEYGKTSYTHLNLEVGTADKLSYSDNYFDFVLFGFCLYLVDRSLLGRSVSEADRVLKDRGFLGITDFDVRVPVVRPYKHFKGLMSYKMDYSQLFLAFPHYSLADKCCFSHSGDFFVEDVNERVASVVLYKNHDNAYVREE